MEKYLLTGLALAIIFVGVLSYNSNKVEGSVIGGNEYNDKYLAEATSTVVKSLPGAFGSVVITSPASAGIVEIFDTASSTATSTANRVARFDSSDDVSGTYTFDVVLTGGLTVDTSGGFDGVYTITYR